jgi:hypothetical protein
MRSKNRWRAGLLAGAIVTVALVSAPLSASASEAKPEPEVIRSAQVWTSYHVVNHTKTSNVVGTQIIGDCTVARNGGTCTITSGKTATRTIQLAFNVTRSAVASSLQISSSTSATISVACTSPPMNAGESWRAKPKGTKHFYKVREQTWAEDVVIASRTSAQLTAFNPSATSIYCY